MCQLRTYTPLRLALEGADDECDLPALPLLRRSAPLTSDNWP